MFSAKDYVYEVYREKSFTLASKKLFVSQPALSASIKKIEKEIGAELFDRSSSPIRLTEAGLAYIEAIEQIYAIEETLKNRISDINNLKSGAITVGSANFISSYVLPEIINAYKSSFSGIKINMTESASEDVKSKALAGLIDAVIDYDFDDKVFKSYPLREETIYLATSKNNPQAEEFKDYALTASEIKNGKAEKKPPFPTEQLDNLCFITLKKGNDMHAHAESIFKEFGTSPKNELQLDQLMTSFNICMKGFWFTFVTDTLIKATDTRNAVFFRINSRNTRRTLQIAHRKNMYVSASLSKFIATAQESCKKL